MPNTREKLIELLDEASLKLTELCGGLNDHNGNGVRADHLIANGVTINRGTEYTPVAYNLSPTAARFLLKENGELIPLTTCQQWIPVSERYPNHGDVVLIYTKDKDIQVFQWDNEYDGWVGDRYNYSTKYVTHWMPLPEPPKEGE